MESLVQVERFNEERRNFERSDVQKSAMMIWYVERK